MARVLAILLGMFFLANPAIVAQEVDADGSASAKDRDTAGLSDEADEAAFTVAPVGTLERPEVVQRRLADLQGLQHRCQVLPGVQP